MLENLLRVAKNGSDIIGDGSVGAPFLTITKALELASFGSVIEVTPGIYNEDIVIPEGVHINGKSNSNTIVYIDTGTVITKNSPGDTLIRNITFKSSPTSGVVDAHTVNCTAGSLIFDNCSIEMYPTNTYGILLSIVNSKMVISNCNCLYKQTGDTNGNVEHIAIQVDGNSTFVWNKNSFTDLTINDGNSSADAIICNCPLTSVVDINMNNSEVKFLSQNPLWNGNCYAKRILGTFVTKIDIVTATKVTIIGSGGTGEGYIFYLDSSTDDCSIYGTLNLLTAIGFSKNYAGFVGVGDTFNSHFDMINAEDSLTGPGTINFVISPGSGNLMISGSYINMYDNDIVVAKRGGEFTSLKAAIDSITDNDSNNRYNIHVHTGIYQEDNPIELKPYVYISGSFKHNPRIEPLNPLEHLFIIPTGYCTCDLGELTLKAPEGDATHQTYLVYAGPGCKPIMGLYQCLFLGDYVDGSYCNGFYDEEVLSGYHTVNCMAYGKFNKYADIVSGNWTDSGFIPEATTEMNYYLHMTGEGIALVDLMRAKCLNIKNLYYVDNENAELIVSDNYSEDQITLCVGQKGGKIRMRGSTLRGQNRLEGGNITIHGGSFENNGFIEGTPGLESLVITGTKNINTYTYCVKVDGSFSTKVFLGGGNIFNSPNGIDPIQLNGPFEDVVVEGVRQFSIASLFNTEEYLLTHLPDMNFSRIVQAQAYPSEAGFSDITYLTTEEANYTQEDNTKTDFVNDIIQLSGMGLVAYGHWELDQIGNKAYAYDTSGNNRTLTLMSMDNNDWVPGHVGDHCLRFDGSSQYVRSDYGVAAWGVNQTFSAECWFKTSNTGKMYIISEMDGIALRGWGIYIDNHRVHFVIQNDETTNSLDVGTTNQVASDTWHHVICTYNGTSSPSGVHIWIDNTDMGLTTHINNISGVSNTFGYFQLGGRYLTYDSYTGDIDEVVLYENKIVSPNEANYRWNNGNGIETFPGTFDITEGWYVTTAAGSQIDTSLWTNIGSILFGEVIISNTQIKYLLSVDAGVTWKYWGGSDWVVGNIDITPIEGNSSIELESLVEVDFDKLFVAGTLDICAILESTNVYQTPILNKIDINYSSPGARCRIGNGSVKIEYTDSTHTKITNISGNTLTGIRVNIMKQVLV